MSVLDKEGSRYLNTYFKANMVVSDTDFELLFTNDVLLWPVGIVLPAK